MKLCRFSINKFLNIKNDFSTKIEVIETYLKNINGLVLQVILFLIFNTKQRDQYQS